MVNVSTTRDKAAKRLSSGRRVNTAADDAAAAAIVEKMTTQIRGLAQNEANIGSGIDMIRTADGALTAVGDMLQRCRELSVQALNDSNTESDKEIIQKEIDRLVEEIHNTIDKAEFNKKPLFVNDAKAGYLKPEYTFGEPGVAEISVPGKPGVPDLRQYVRPQYTEIFSVNEKIAGIDIALGNLPNPPALDSLKRIVNDFSRAILDGDVAVKVVIGVAEAMFERYESADPPIISTDAIDAFNAVKGGIDGTAYADAYASIVNAVNDALMQLNNIDEFAYEKAPLGKDVYGREFQVIINDAVTALGAAVASAISDIGKTNFEIAQAAYSAMPMGRPDIPGVTIPGKPAVPPMPAGPGEPHYVIQIGPNAHQLFSTALPMWLDTHELGIDMLDVTTILGGNTALQNIDNALMYVTSVRSKLGSQQNVLEMSKNSGNVTYDNLSASRSAVNDADMAKELMNFTKAVMMTDAGVAFMAQANSQPQAVLSLRNPAR
jgi:flagellin